MNQKLVIKTDSRQKMQRNQIKLLNRVKRSVCRVV